MSQANETPSVQTPISTPTKKWHPDFSTPPNYRRKKVSCPRGFSDIDFIVHNECLVAKSCPAAVCRYKK